MMAGTPNIAAASNASSIRQIDVGNDLGIYITHTVPQIHIAKGLAHPGLGPLDLYRDQGTPVPPIQHSAHIGWARSGWWQSPSRARVSPAGLGRACQLVSKVGAQNLGT